MQRGTERTNQLASQLHVPDFKDVTVFDDDVVHVHGLELVEVFREGDQMDGGAFMELKKLGIIVVSLPSERRQLTLKNSVRGHDLISWDVYQHFAASVGVGTSLSSRILKTNNSVLEDPNAGHFCFDRSGQKLCV